MKKYTADDIEVLEGAEAVRKNVGMYLGSAETQVLRAFREIFENAIDVFARGDNDFVSVVLEGNKLPQTFTVIDHGKYGIPVEKHKKTGISTLTTIFTTLHSGANFSKLEEDKAITRGKHGVGSSATCACAERFVVITRRDDKWYTQTFEKGVPVDEVTVLNKFPSKFRDWGAKNCGTVIQFTPDYTVLPKTLIKQQFLYEYVKQIANLNSGLKIRFVSEKYDETFCNKKGIITLLNEYIESKEDIETIGRPFVFESNNLQVGVQWSNLEGENVLSYCNLANTPEGGTHVAGLYDALTKAFKSVGGRGIDFTASDLRWGLIGVIHYKCNDDDYSGQSKEKLNTLSATKIVKDTLEAPLASWIAKNKKTVREICLHATRIKAAKTEIKKISKAASSIKTTKKGNLLDSSKLIQCSKKCPPSEIELFLVEGNSASSTCSTARNPYFQEILKCRGKGLNILRAPTSKALANKEISSFLVAIAADEKEVKTTQTVSNFRVGKILLFSDPDVDAPLSEDTKVITLRNGIHKLCPIADLAEEWNKSHTPIPVLGKDSKGNVVSALAYNPSVREITDTYYKIVLNDESEVCCTGNHPWALVEPDYRTYVSNNIHYCTTDLLRIGDKLDGNIFPDNKPYKYTVTDIVVLHTVEKHPFYCMTVPATGNFYISDKYGNGLLSSNCHIDALWLTWIYRFAKAALKQGMVYKVNVPLYQAAWHEKDGDKRAFGDTLEEIKALAPKNAFITRFKGLGELKDSQLKPFIDPKTRHITQITYPEAKKKVQEFLQIMGEDVEYRKEMLDISRSNHEC